MGREGMRPQCGLRAAVTDEALGEEKESRCPGPVFDRLISMPLDIIP